MEYLQHFYWLLTYYGNFHDYFSKQFWWYQDHDCSTFLKFYWTLGSETLKLTAGRRVLQGCNVLLYFLLDFHFILSGVTIIFFIFFLQIPHLFFFLTDLCIILNESKNANYIIFLDYSTGREIVVAEIFQYSKNFPAHKIFGIRLKIGTDIYKRII